MTIAPQYIPAAYSLTAVGVWGTSDFLGGVGASRANAFLFTAIVHLSGMVLDGAVALITHAAFPDNYSLAGRVVAGAVAARSGYFLSFLGTGEHGAGCSRCCVLGAAIPTIVSAFDEGVPGYRHLLALWWPGSACGLSREPKLDRGGRKSGNGGVGGDRLAGFYLCIHARAMPARCGPQHVRGLRPCW